MTTDRWRGEIAALRGQYAEVLDPLIPESSAVALLDYPNHPNVGDSAIWLGELEYLHRRRCSLRYVSDIVSHDAGRLAQRLPSDGVILLHGGGNLGDLWPVHQRFRERVLREHPGHRVVMLPQTINFRDPQTLDQARRSFAAHRDLFLIARDAPSHAFAVDTFDCHVALAPDSAFWLSPKPREATQDVVWLGRTDREAAAAQGDAPSGLAITPVDWLASGTSGWSPGRVRFRLLRELTRVLGRLSPQVRPRCAAPQQALFGPVGQWHVNRGCDLLGAGRVVVTDRLHAHLLSVLLGVPQVLLDDAHLKVRHFWGTWTKDLPGIVWAGDPAEAVALAATLRE